MSGLHQHMMDCSGAPRGARERTFRVSFLDLASLNLLSITRMLPNRLSDAFVCWFS